MGIRQTLASQASDPHGPLGWIAAWIMPLQSDAHCGDLAGLLALRPEDEVLDVACGAGVFLQKRASHVRHAAGIDHSEIQIRMARKRNRDGIVAGTVEIVWGDSAALPWKDDRFSAVACNCLSCLSQPQPSLQEMHRVLRPGGRVALSFDDHRDVATARREEQKWGLPAWTEPEFRTMLEEAGFSVASMSRAGKLAFARAVKQ